MRRRPPVHHPEIHRVTTADRAASEGIDERLRRYSWTMGIRVVCVLLAALLPIPLWSKALFLVGGIVLPWIAVVAANSGDKVDRRETHLVTHTDQAQLSAPTNLGQPLVIDSTASERDPADADGGLRRRSA